PPESRAGPRASPVADGRPRDADRRAGPPDPRSPPRRAGGLGLRRPGKVARGGGGFVAGPRPRPGGGSVSGGARLRDGVDAFLRSVPRPPVDRFALKPGDAALSPAWRPRRRRRRRRAR